MKIDTTEFAALALVDDTPRVDLYSVVHKALRAMMGDTLVALGRIDVGDAAERARVTTQVRELLDFCASHLEHENLYVHPAIEARAPGASERIAHDHEEHQRHIAALRARVASLEQATPPRAALAAARALYRELALFMADNLRHMHVEETAHNAVMWARYTDAELVAIHTALVGAIPAQEMAFTLRWMLPAMGPEERSAMLADMRTSAPTQVFEGTLDIARRHLDRADWAKLAASLGLGSVAA